MRDSKKCDHEVSFEEFVPELTLWDDDDVAFIKHGKYEGRSMWLVFSSDGKQIAATEDRDFAFILAKYNDYDPCSVH